MKANYFEKHTAAQRRDAWDETQRNVVQAMGWCIYIALHDEMKVGRQRLEKVAAEVDRYEQRYTEKVYCAGKRGALKGLAEEVRKFTDPEMRVPLTRSARNSFENQMRIAANEAASISWQLFALACRHQLGYGDQRLQRVKQAAYRNYEQYNQWYLDGGKTRRADGTNYFDGELGRRYALEKMAGCIEAILNEEVRVVDNPTKEKPDLFTSGAPEPEQRSADTYAALRMARRVGIMPKAKGNGVLSGAEIERIAAAAKERVDAGMRSVYLQRTCDGGDGK